MDYEKLKERLSWWQTSIDVEVEWGNEDESSMQDLLALIDRCARWVDTKIDGTKDGVTIHSPRYSTPVPAGEYQVERDTPDMSCYPSGPREFKHYCDDDFSAEGLANLLNTLTARVKELESRELSPGDVYELCNKPLRFWRAIANYLDRCVVIPDRDYITAESIKEVRARVEKIWEHGNVEDALVARVRELEEELAMTRTKLSGLSIKTFFQGAGPEFDDAKK
jgi:hypothetical protein